jgi:hypothetical protein
MKNDHMKKVFLVFYCLLLVACRQEKQVDNAADSLSSTKMDSALLTQVDEGEYERFQDFRNYVVKGEVPVEEIQVIDSVAALIVNPTDEQIDQMLKENGEEDFSTIADDASFYQSEGIIALDSFGINTVDATKRYIKFVGRTESWVLDIRQKGAPAWNIIFFDPKTTPQVNSWVDINFDELIAYYGTK